jgi:hypothetical protein
MEGIVIYGTSTVPFSALQRTILTFSAPEDLSLEMSATAARGPKNNTLLDQNWW